MPHFSAKGNDTYICQKCATIYDSVDHPPTHGRTDIVAHGGNVCPTCVAKHAAGTPIPTPTRMTYSPGSRPGRDEADAPMGLVEYCRRESGGLEGVALMRYVNRYYGHG